MCINIKQATLSEALQIMYWINQSDDYNSYFENGRMTYSHIINDGVS